jgi:2-hydroxy-6-oxonona-2,4-dienedioate hydrolase
MPYEVKQDGKFKYLEQGEGEPLVLLHGLFGAMSNFTHLLDFFSPTHKVIVPMLPLYELDIFHTSVNGLANHVKKFIEHFDLKNIHMLGNSLGGHVALEYILKHPERIKSIILTGSSGLYEHGMGDTYPKRGDREYIKNKTELTFYDPKTATEELIDEVYDIVNNRLKAIKIIALAKSAIRNNLGKELVKIDKPTLLILPHHL